MRRVLLLLSPLALYGFTCGPGVDPPGLECDDDTPAPAMGTVTIGQLDGDGAFEAANDDQRYPLEFGAQGGQHIHVSLRFYADANEEWGHDMILRDADGRQVGSRYVVEPSCAPGWGTLSNLRVFVDSPDVDGGTLTVQSSPYDPARGTTDPARTLEAQADLRIR